MPAGLVARFPPSTPGAGGGAEQGRSDRPSGPEVPDTAPVGRVDPLIGVRERVGRHQGRWRDVVLLERRSPVVG
ncbi:hypothetical protein [Micromonospora inositola]|uniref:hypothetical protein n=1 Tax=Micromonospora inositola TaxID=47865 RepID=UPI000B5AF195|nr:hypothetical protein [Micromonospora inositola]